LRERLSRGDAEQAPRRGAVPMSHILKALRAPETEGGAAPGQDTAAGAEIIVPVRNFVMFPGVVMPLTVGRPRSVAAAQQAVREGRRVGILMQRDPEMADPAAIDLHRVGVLA